MEALILAAGEARRFGRPKQLLPWGSGKTILSHVIDTVQATPGIDSTRVVLGAWFDEIRAALATTLTRVDVIRNSDWQIGMFSSLKAGLTQFTGSGKNDKKIDGIIVLLGDMPFITTETLARFVAAAPAANPRPLIASEGCRPAHPYLIRHQHIGDILSLSGESGIRPFIKKEFPAAHKIAVENSVGRRDIDTWESYFKNRPTNSAAVIPPPPDYDRLDT
ncbi:MAG: nucleotidyltransferase family protein [Deltaproteobacteria bacterium]|nr:nucleotidyltransferase family protein [Deltaproteobacteria bacterium]